MHLGSSSKRVRGAIIGSLLFMGCAEEPAEFDPQDFEEGMGQGQGGNTDPLKTAQPDASAQDASVPDASVLDASLQLPSSDAGRPLNELYARAFDVFTARCVDCHGAGKTLDLSTPEVAHRELVGIPARYKACATDAAVPKVRVIANAPGASLLIEKIDGTPSCGKPMPTMGSLAPAETAAIRAWVEGGAKLH